MYMFNESNYSQFIVGCCYPILNSPIHSCDLGHWNSLADKKIKQARANMSL